MQRHAFVMLFVLFAAAGCGRFRLNPTVPLRTTPIAGVTVTYDPSLADDKRRMLDRNDVPGEMERALMASFPRGAGPMIQATITEFRSGRWDATRMHVVANLLDANGQIVGQLQADSTAVMGMSRGDLLQRVAQDCVNQIASQLQ
jgi:hypothetical protein